MEAPPTAGTAVAATEGTDGTDGTDAIDVTDGAGEVATAMEAGKSPATVSDCGNEDDDDDDGGDGGDDDEFTVAVTGKEERAPVTLSLFMAASVGAAVDGLLGADGSAGVAPCNCLTSLAPAPSAVAAATVSEQSAVAEVAGGESLHNAGTAAAGLEAEGSAGRGL